MQLDFSDKVSFFVFLRKKDGMLNKSTYRLFYTKIQIKKKEVVFYNSYSKRRSIRIKQKRDSFWRRRNLHYKNTPQEILLGGK